MKLPLSVSAGGGVLKITIGIDTLAYAFEQGPVGDGWSVTDTEAFALDVAEAMDQAATTGDERTALEAFLDQMCEKCARRPSRAARPR